VETILNASVKPYARELGIATPFFLALTNLVKAREDSYLGEKQQRAI
jgi:ketopantoate reductase